MDSHIVDHADHLAEHFVSYGPLPSAVELEVYDHIRNVFSSLLPVPCPSCTNLHTSYALFLLPRIGTCLSLSTTRFPARVVHMHVSFAVCLVENRTKIYK